MGIVWLSAPHSTQRQDVWPPSESFPPPKMKHAERKTVAMLLFATQKKVSSSGFPLLVTSKQLLRVTFNFLFYNV